MGTAHCQCLVSVFFFEGSRLIHSGTKRRIWNDNSNQQTNKILPPTLHHSSKVTRGRKRNGKHLLDVLCMVRRRKRETEDMHTWRETERGRTWEIEWSLVQLYMICTAIYDMYSYIWYVQLCMICTNYKGSNLTNSYVLRMHRRLQINKKTNNLKNGCRPQCPRGLRRRSAAARLLGLWVRIPAGAWKFVCCDCCVL